MQKQVKSSSKCSHKSPEWRVISDFNPAMVAGDLCISETADFLGLSCSTVPRVYTERCGGKKH